MSDDAKFAAMTKASELEQLLDDREETIRRLQSQLDTTNRLLYAEQVHSEEMRKQLREALSRLETALKWIEAVRSCDGDRWECSVCGHSEPWWTHSNADELTKDIAVENLDPERCQAKLAAQQCVGIPDHLGPHVYGAASDNR